MAAPQNDEASTAPEYVFVGSNFHRYTPRGSDVVYDRKTANKKFPRNVTLGFRNNFWRVFSRVQRYRQDSARFEWLGRQWQLCEIWMAESRDVDFSTYLQNKQNVFLVFVLKPIQHDAFRSVRSLSFELGLDEQGTIATLIEAVSHHYSKSHLQSFEHERKFNALFTWSDSPKDGVLEATVAFFAFYSFCLLMTWKISRDQTKIGLKLDAASFRGQMQQVLQIRSQIINVQRYFLTKNVSNDDELKRIDRSIKERFRLRAKIEDFLPLNEAIERHLSTAAQLRADQKASTLNRVALLIAIIGLPIAIVSMVLTVNSDQGVIRDGLLLLASNEVATVIAEVFLIAFGILALVSAGALMWQRLPGVRALEERETPWVAADERLTKFDSEE